MKIIEAISDTNIGGAGVLLLTRLVNDKQMCDNTVVVIPKGSMLKNKLSEHNISFIEVNACADRSFELSAILKYIKLIKKISPDIVNCHGCLSFRIAAFLCGVPVRIYTRHCAFPLSSWQKNPFLRFITGKCQMCLSNGIVAVAQAAKDNLVEMGVLPDRVTVIINGVNEIKTLSDSERSEIKKSLFVPNNATVIGIFARLEEYKGHTDIINAAELLIKLSEDYRFLIVGGGSMQNELKNICKSKGIDKYFIFTGFVDDVTKYFNITDLNINCSHGTETSSLALSEGMSLGIPCVASDYGGNGYMVQNGINGFLYPIYDFERLAEIIYCITNDKNLYEQLSKNASLRYERELNAKKMTEATYKYYTQLQSVKEKCFSSICRNS
ncbi:MAG: glycosyltransferase [Clostridia bacterium]|nr:glycosyltransferase [Clostridia bacterium]